MSKRVAIVQSSYVPWKGYFDLIRSVDEFILYDDVQFTRRDWRSRNRIKTARGPQWLSVPVQVKGRFEQRICEAQVDGTRWAHDHWQSLRHSYSKAPCFARYAAAVERAYADCAGLASLSAVNRRLIECACQSLGIATPLSWSMDYDTGGDRSERLLGLCKAAGASHYLSGPAAKGYLDVALFERNDVGVSFADYEGYPAYDQLHPPFDHAVTVLDLIFHLGDDALSYMKPQH